MIHKSMAERGHASDVERLARRSVRVRGRIGSGPQPMSLGAPPRHARWPVMMGVSPDDHVAAQARRRRDASVVLSSRGVDPVSSLERIEP